MTDRIMTAHEWIRCDWPGYKCNNEAEFFYKNKKHANANWRDGGYGRPFVCRCGDHKPNRAGDFPTTIYERVSRAVFIVGSVMEI